MAEYRIILQNAGGASTDNSGVKIAAGSNGSTIKSAQSAQQQASSMPLGTMPELAVAQSAWNTGKRVIGGQLSHFVTTTQLRTGSAGLQEQMQFGLEVGSFIGGALESAVIGGAVGGGAGAIVGALSSILSSMYGYYLQQKTIDLRTAVEDVTINQNAIRAGTGGSRLGQAGRI